MLLLHQRVLLLTFLLEMKLYFGDIRSKVDSKIIECRKNKSWICKACNSLNTLKDSNVVRCDYNKGYDKLFSHVETNHKDFLNILYDKRKSVLVAFGNTSLKAKNIYGHLDDLTSNNRSFRDCSKPKYRLYSSLRKT